MERRDIDSESEEEKLRKLYDQACAQGNRKKKREYEEKIAELNRLRKSAQRESNRSKSWGSIGVSHLFRKRKKPLIRRR